MAERRGRAPGVPKVEPWHPSDYELADAAALQAVANGTANADQQRRAYHYIMYCLASTYDLSYRSTSAHDTSFAEGKRFVGLQMVKFATINLETLKRKSREQGETPTKSGEANG